MKIPYYFRYIMLSLLLLIGSHIAQAGIEVRDFDTPQQREVYDKLMYELRCLVCQNENLAASNADLAKDLRDEVYEMLTEKKMSEAEVKTFLVARYGDFVLYKPPVKESTLLLWAGPFILLLLGFVIMFFVLKHNRRQPEVKLNDAKRSEMKKILELEDK